MTNNVFVQIGASRDGLDSYRAAASRRSMTTVLVENPDYLTHRATLPGRSTFDHCAAVEQPANPHAVLEALCNQGIRPRLVLSGFERYVDSAWDVARLLAPSLFHRTNPPTSKDGQRGAILTSHPEVKQPKYARIPDLTDIDQVIESFPYPAVIKPVNGGGGLGVYYAGDQREARSAVGRISELRNYDGTQFPCVIIEELVTGTEFSVQAMAVCGKPHILAYCEKLIGREPDPGHVGLWGFRELAHVATPGSHTPPLLQDLVHQVISGLNYLDGPFHLDLIRRQDGEWVFLEAGYRLSGGGIVSLVERATGQNWGEIAFSQALGEQVPEVPSKETLRSFGTCLLPTMDHVKRAKNRHEDQVEIELHINRIERPKIGPASDLLRHSGFAGRAFLAGPTRETVIKAIFQIFGKEVSQCVG